MKFLNVILAILLLSSTTSFAQKVVISEYFNISGVPDNEWTELLVTEDNVNLVGYSLIDNSGSLESWSGGIKFKDVPLWRNLRRGTIIVILHRGNQAIDEDASDGYIEIRAENTTYYEQFCTDCLDWAETALNINQTNDILQLRDAAGNNVHTLANITNANTGDFGTTTGPKLAYNQLVANGASVRVTPGANLADFTGGINPNKVRSNATTFGSSAGIPNDFTTNANFWRTMRQPTWNNPTLTITPSQNNLTLNWNNAETDTDNSQGYLIVEYSNEPTANDLPTDGTIYTIGQQIGAGKVVAISTSAQNTATIARPNLQCGNSVYYRVFAYRYAKDQQNRDNSPNNARGRSYNEQNYAQAIFELPRPDKPLISLDKDKVCIGDSATIRVEFVPNSINRMEILLGDNVVYNLTGDFSSGIRTVKVGANGEYTAIVYNQLTCQNRSDVVRLNVIEDADAFVSNDSFARYTSDTEINLCAGQEQLIRFGGGQKVELLKDGQVIATNQFEYRVTQSGQYYVKATNGDLCTNESVVLTFNFLETNIELSTTQIDFGTVEVSGLANFIIENKSNNPLTIQILKMADDIIIDSPVFPLTLQNGQSQEVSLRWIPGSSGEYIDEIIFGTSCNKELNLTLTGFKNESNVSSSRGIIDFGTLTSCLNLEKTESVSITNNGQLPITLAQFISTDNMFTSTMIPADFKLGVNETYNLGVSFKPMQEGQFEELLLIPFTSDGTNYDTLKIVLRGQYKEIKVELSANTFDFGEISECETQISESLFINNNSIYPVEIEILNQAGISFLATGRVNIGGNGQYRVNFDYIPQSANDDLTVNFKIVECSSDIPLNLKSEKSGYLLTYSTDTLDFGTFYLCEGNSQSAKVYNKIVLGGNSSKNFVIKNISTQGEFTLDNTEILSKQYKVGDEIELEIGNTFSQIGLFTGQIIINYDPCDKTISIPVKIKIENINLQSAPANLDFATLDGVGAYQEIEFILTNNGSLDVYLSKNTVVQPEIELSFDNKDVIGNLVLVKALSSISIKANYIGAGRIDIDSQIELKVEQPCQTAINIPIKVEARKLDPITMKLQIEPNANYEPGKEFVVKVSIVGVEHDRIINSNLTQIGAKFLFNSTIFRLKRFEVNQAEQFINDIIIEQVASGEIACRILTNSRAWDSNAVHNFNIIYDAYLGDEENTSIILSELDAVSRDSIVVESTGGNYGIINVCAPGKRLITAFNSSYIAHYDGEVITSNTTFRLNVKKDGETKLQVYDILGNYVIGKVIESKSEQVSDYSLDYRLPQGIYFLVLQDRGFVQTKKIMITE